mgnify:CR=1 FL=1
MVSAAWVSSLVEAFCSCALCGVSFDSGSDGRIPRQLGCGHTVCTQCSLRCGSCPVCRGSVALPLPVDSASLALADHLAELSLWDRRRPDGDGYLSCDVCADGVAEDARAVSHCADCRLLLCSIHDAAHGRARGSRHHMREPVAALPPPAGDAAPFQSSRCAHHHLPIDAMCAMCNVPLCSECISSSLHASHDRRSLSDTLAVSAAALRGAAKEASHVALQHAEKLHVVRDHAVLVENLAREMNGQIDRYFDDLAARLGERRERLHADVAVARQTHLNSVAALGDVVSARLGGAKRAREALEGVLMSGDVPCMALAGRAAASIGRRAHSENGAVVAELARARDMGVFLPLGDDVESVGSVRTASSQSSSSIAARKHHHHHHHHHRRDLAAPFKRDDARGGVAEEDMAAGTAGEPSTSAGDAQAKEGEKDDAAAESTHAAQLSSSKSSLRLAH